jgi:predicted nucleic acid-binding protein
MSFLLDTNICSAHLKCPAGLTHRLIQRPGRLHIPTIVLGELLDRLT